MEGFWKRPPSRYNTVMPKLDPSYPWLCGEGQFSHPSSSNQHEILSLIQAYQTKGYMKKCAHLKIPEAPPIQSRPWDYIHFFSPRCEEEAFDFHKNEDGNQCFYGCPKSCLLYKAVWRSKMKNFWDKHYWPSRDGVIGIFQYYSSLSHSVQVIIALAFLAWLGSPWENVVLEIVKPYLPK